MRAGLASRGAPAAPPPLPRKLKLRAACRLLRRPAPLSFSGWALLHGVTGIYTMIINCGACVLRPWRTSDEQHLIANARSRAVWLNLRDRFPHPYTLADAQAWFSIVSDEAPVEHLAIEVAGEAAGGIGIELGSDVERCSAEIGYWLGERYWGRGIMSAALVGMTEYVWEQFPVLERIFAVPYVRNGASYRVLEKAGYEREGRLRRSAIKDGEVLDQFMYARVRR